MLIGGTGSGKMNLAIAVGTNYVCEREARVRVFNTVDLVSQLEVEARAGKTRRLATQWRPLTLNHADDQLPGRSDIL